MRYAGLDARLRRLGYETEDLGNLHIRDRDTLAAERRARLPAGGGRGLRARLRHRPRARSRAAACRSFSAAITRSRSAPSAASLTTSRSACCGSTPTPTSTRPRPHPPATCTACRSRRCSATATGELVDVGRPGPSSTRATSCSIGVRDSIPARRELIRDHRRTASTRCASSTSGRRGGRARGAGPPRPSLAPAREPRHGRRSIPREAPGVGTPVDRRPHLSRSAPADGDRGQRGERRARSTWSRSTRSSTTRNQTARLAVGLIASLLGKSIL